MTRGTGKTITSLSIAEKLYNKTKIKNIIVICPVSKVQDWKDDLKKEVPQIKVTFVSSFQSAWRDKNSTSIKLLMSSETMLIIDERT